MTAAAAVLLGMSDPEGADPRLALLPRSRHSTAHSLLMLSGMEQHEYLNRYFRLNLNGQNIEELLAHLRIELPRARELRVVGVGAEVREQFGLENFFRWEDWSAYCPMRVATIPFMCGAHRSPLEERRKVARVLRQARRGSCALSDLVAFTRRQSFIWRPKPGPKPLL